MQCLCDVNILHFRLFLSFLAYKFIGLGPNIFLNLSFYECFNTTRSWSCSSVVECWPTMYKQDWDYYQHSDKCCIITIRLFQRLFSWDQDLLFFGGPGGGVMDGHYCFPVPYLSLFYNLVFLSIFFHDAAFPLQEKCFQVYLLLQL